MPYFYQFDDKGQIISKVYSKNTPVHNNQVESDKSVLCHRHVVKKGKLKRKSLLRRGLERLRKRRARKIEKAS